MASSSCCEESIRELPRTSLSLALLGLTLTARLAVAHLQLEIDNEANCSAPTLQTEPVLVNT